MEIKASTDGVGKSLEIRLDARDTRQKEVRALSDLIVFLMEELRKKL